MQNPTITFVAPYTVEMRKGEPIDTLEPDELLIESLYSLVSPGTELACLSGKESWFKLPRAAGYANVGTVVAVGKAVEKFNEGDVVLNYGRHKKYNRMSEGALVLQVPDGIDLKLVPLTRMATVAFTAIRVSDIELGDDVAVVGLGLVGNMAAQLAGLQGGQVIGIDLVEKRLDVAHACGVGHTINPAQEDATARIVELTSGTGVHSLIDATGNPTAILNSLPWIGRRGELILLGSPRGEHQADLTDVLNYVHLHPRGTITFKGAHEWRYPTLHDPFVKHSLERNSRVVWRLYQEGKLELDKLITHVVKPQDAASIYEGLRTSKDEYLGCVFDWTE